MIKCDDCGDRAVVFYMTPMGSGYSCYVCMDTDPETENEWLDET
jgi:ribosomal protein S27E